LQTRMKLYETASTCSRADALQDMALSHISSPITELRIMKPFFCWRVSCTEDICYVGWARGRLGIRFANDRIILEIHGERISHDWHNGERDL